MCPVPFETEEELQKLKQYLLLQFSMDVIEYEIKVLQKAPLKMPPVHIQVWRSAQDKMHKDLTKARRFLRQRGLKVYEQRRTELGVEIEYLCRGYRRSMSFVRRYVKAEVQNLLCAYLCVTLDGDGGQQ